MIKKFKLIKDMGVFKDFKWDDCVKDKQGCIVPFKQVNVIYGRNYSGKTTLSRIMRALEVGVLSDKYCNPKFIIETANECFTEKNYIDNQLLVRVFNDDFIKDNLMFISDSDKNIRPFTVLGKENKEKNSLINNIKKAIGENSGENSTGLYLKKFEANNDYIEKGKIYNSFKDEFEKQLSKKATDKNIGIKYKPNRFGNQNYNIKNLRDDLECVISDKYVPIDEKEKSIYENQLSEKTIILPSKLPRINLSIVKIFEEVKLLCSRKIINTKKIQELVNNTVVEEWVHSGIAINNKRRTCAFCGQPINSERWQRLYDHFNEDMEKLQEEIGKLLEKIDIELEMVSNGFLIDESKFYLVFKNKIIKLKGRYDVELNKYINSINTLKKFLIDRKENIHIVKDISYSLPEFKIKDIYDEYVNLYDQMVEYSNGISERKKIAQKQLRLLEVYEFQENINYKRKLVDEERLRRDKEKAYENLYSVENEIKCKNEEIKHLKLELIDETQGANTVNEYLKIVLGNNRLKLVIKNTEEKQVYFEVERNGEKAYNLSNGEESLIAFCYFIAKLNDIETVNSNPIIWIDDPVSSLDNNHIYFIYSLINQEILAKNRYEQLFISTHNLQFLKYLRVLSIKNHSQKDGKGINRTNLIVQRNGNESKITLMPKYLKDHGTEFNYWFKCIYNCSQMTEINEENMYLFESFGNVVRKFLETYLYYRYPDNDDFNGRLKRFFAGQELLQVVVRKISDEQSHADGDLENHDVPFDEVNIINVAKKIIEKIEETDRNQYEALINSIK